MKHSKVKHIADYIYIAISFFLLLFISSCTRSKYDFIIGVSQCSDDEWRSRMNEEIKREALFYPNLKVDINTVKDNSDEQIKAINNFISKGVDLLIVSPNEAEAITPVVEKAFNNGIPVVLVDRKITSDKYTAFVGGDNYFIGKQIGTYIADRLNGEGKIVELTGLKGSTPALERQKGMNDVLKDFPSIEIIATADAAWLKANAECKFDSILSRHKEIDLVFAQNDRMASGAYEAARKAGREKEMLFVGVDALAGEKFGVELVTDSVLDATFIYPTGGDKAIQVAMDILQGKKFERENLLSSALVNAGNARIMQMQTSHIKTLDGKIEILNRKLDAFLMRYSSQKMFLYACIVIAILLAVLLFFVVRAYWMKIRLNAELSRQKQQLEEQRDQLIDLSRKLEEATKAKLSFFTNVSHDFRTPLTLIADPVKRLMESENINDNEKFLLGIINKNVTVLLRLINQIMDFRKFENGKLDMHLSEFNIRDCVKEWAEAFRTLSYRKHITFRFNAEEGDYNVIADAEMMERITYNLLSNAFKFTPENGSINISVCREGDDRITMKLSDTGVGMPAEHVKHIFESFYQIDVHHAGSGIGLALVKAFVEMHHGNISVESAEGSGTVFTISIPVKQDGTVTGSVDRKALLTNLKEGAVVMADQESLKAESNNAGKKDVSKGIVLVIDDNQDVREYVRSLLYNQYSVLEAANGSEGLKLAIANVPDIIICDVMMPVMDGMECCRRLKAEPRTSHIPVMMLTAYSMDEQKIKGYECGADSYISKPFSSELLMARLHNLIDNRKRLKDFFGDKTLANTTPLADADKGFVEKLRRLIEENIGNADFSVEEMGEQIGFSRVQLYRKAKALTGYTPNELLRIARLNKANAIIKTSSEKSISEIAYEVGFSSPSYFTKCYKEFFGENPTDVLKKK
ncbi:substrate-binding domain-containing protein [Bacteroides caecigallinarum]|uniref:substrate-binding domain-containing protein n=1 Tax=Bacteroides caecigallinarum TaxID=1411144 RepID=UPI001F2A937C|nr:substrate-binding domain-containing protein [Bacteroides caecigallinarum]MCF2552263.1 substrate-binding domain-containing protein [Bacteroides caecigallinarum]